MHSVGIVLSFITVAISQSNYQLLNYRGGDTPVEAVPDDYNYAPSVILDGVRNIQLII